MTYLKYLTVIAVISLTALPSHADTLFATNTAGSLLRFDSASPGNIAASVVIGGLQSNETLLGIDFRPADFMLYGLGSTGRIYTINTTTGAATAVGMPGLFSITGTSFGFDFNPVPDRIRVTSTADQNLRLNPNDGTLTATDGTLAYAAGDANAGQNPNIVGSAYTNSIAGATATTLYGIDSLLDILVTQNPPNNGTLNTVGSLGFNTTDNVAFDIAFPGNIGYAALQAAGAFSGLYSINLNTGAATLIGSIGQGQTITGLAAAPVPEPGAFLLVGLGIGMVCLRRAQGTIPRRR